MHGPCLQNKTPGGAVRVLSTPAVHRQEVRWVLGAPVLERETHVQTLVPAVLLIDHTWLAHTLWTSVSPAAKWVG